MDISLRSLQATVSKLLYQHPMDVISMEAKNTQMHYRGICYQSSHSNLETTQGEIAGFYRGVPWRRQYLKKQPVPQAIARLKYRGADYFRVVCSEQVKPGTEVDSIKSV
ncbi:DUF4278 domain-containing protein [Coleofasciculus sp. FACHB-1120]|uniref:DUF4278 domain-containing protein n=1 Tax=Coleofasciculus sp. FACHB-1120 TaxID=2692783 RepID=UPI001688E7C8|nr:DUF4278 domain-containing protein [Coleofasciculus sp. FACHB-1120]MBD2743797.1 DUF4278 domain-containing protein [Coleofasciculus sp. FACHB-1120]